MIFFSEQPFYGNYSTLDSHTNTVIFHAFAYSSRWCHKPWHGLYCNYLLTTMQGDHSHVCLAWLTHSLTHWIAHCAFPHVNMHTVEKDHNHYCSPTAISLLILLQERKFKRVNFLSLKSVIYTNPISAAMFFVSYKSESDRY